MWEGCGKGVWVCGHSLRHRAVTDGDQESFSKRLLTNSEKLVLSSIPVTHQDAEVLRASVMSGKSFVWRGRGIQTCWILIKGTWPNCEMSVQTFTTDRGSIWLVGCDRLDTSL